MNTSTYIIHKDFEFCYGHRVSNQQLQANFADDTKCSCRHLHGHEGRVTVAVASESLHRDMVTDFRHLEFVKRFINQYLDHHFILDRADPLYQRISGDPLLLPVHLMGSEQVAGWVPDLAACAHLSPAELELVEGLFVVDFVPTSENLSAWMAGLIGACIEPLGVQLHSVTWWETPRSRSEFRCR